MKLKERKIDRNLLCPGSGFSMIPNCQGFFYTSLPYLSPSVLPVGCAQWAIKHFHGVLFCATSPASSRKGHFLLNHGIYFLSNSFVVFLYFFFFGILLQHMFWLSQIFRSFDIAKLLLLPHFIDIISLWFVLNIISSFLILSNEYFTHTHMQTSIRDLKAYYQFLMRLGTQILQSKD